MAQRGLQQGLWEGWRVGGGRYAPMGHVMGAVIKTARWSGCACMLMVQRPANKALCPFQSRPAQRPYACSDQPQL